MLYFWLIKAHEIGRIFEKKKNLRPQLDPLQLDQVIAKEVSAQALPMAPRAPKLVNPRDQVGGEGQQRSAHHRATPEPTETRKPKHRGWNTAGLERKNTTG